MIISIFTSLFLLVRFIEWQKKIYISIFLNFLLLFFHVTLTFIQCLYL